MAETTLDVLLLARKRLLEDGWRPRHAWVEDELAASRSSKRWTLSDAVWDQEVNRHRLAARWILNRLAGMFLDKWEEIPLRSWVEVDELLKKAIRLAGGRVRTPGKRELVFKSSRIHRGGPWVTPVGVAS